MFREALKRVGVMASILVVATGAAFSPVMPFSVSAESAYNGCIVKAEKDSYSFAPDDTSYEKPVFINLLVSGIADTDYYVDFDGTETMGNIMLWSVGTSGEKYDSEGNMVISLHGYKCVNDGRVIYGQHILHVNVRDKDNDILCSTDIIVTLERKKDDFDEKQTTVEAKAVKPVITLSKTEFVYNGKIQKPKITVTADEKTLSESDYDIQFATGCKEVGKHKVTVTLKGSYIGTASTTYIINPKGVSLSKTSKAQNGFKAKWKKQTKQVTGYQIQYSTNKKFTKNLRTVVIKQNKVTSKKITAKAGKKYYVRIRTYKTVKGKKYYSAWSKTKNIKVK